MTEQGFIAKYPKLDQSQDYAFLRAEGLEHIRTLGHRLWTDHNIHDPGITLLELLCYAITDLGYRTGYDIKDVLTAIEGGIPVNRGQFHTARNVFTNNPVSFDDLRKLLIDIRGVRNAWIEPNTSIEYWLGETQRRLFGSKSDAKCLTENPPLNGLYDIFIERESFVEADPRSIRAGLPYDPEGEGEYVDPVGGGLRFHVSHELILEEVTVRSQAKGSIAIELRKQGGETIDRCEPKAIAEPGEPTKISLGFRISPGADYQLVVYKPKGTVEPLGAVPPRLWRSKNKSFPYSVDDVVHIVGGVEPGNSPSTNYNFFYDWRIGYAAPPAGPQGPKRMVSHVGPPDHSGPGSYVAPRDKCIEFRVTRGAVLDAVHVYAESSGEVTIRLLDADGRVQREATGVVEHARTRTRVALGFPLSPPDGSSSPDVRTYRLDAAGTTVRLYQGTEAAYPYTHGDVIELVSGYPVTGWLYFFHDWEISYAAPAAGAPAAPQATARVGPPDHSDGGGYIEPRYRGIDFRVMRNLMLEAVHVYAGATGEITVRLLDIDGIELESKNVEVTARHVRTRLPLGFELVPRTRYRLDARGTAIRLYQGAGADFPYGQPNVDAIELVSSHPPEDAINFFYDWEVSYPEYPHPATVTSEDVRRAVIERLHTHRNLSEDLIEIHDLEVEQIAVCTDIEVSPDADVDEVLGEIYHQLDLHISPRVKFHTIEDLLDRGGSIDQIFEGPALDHGFIDHEEFVKIRRKSEIRTSDVVRILMNLRDKGVRAIKNISLLSFIELADGNVWMRQEDWILELTADAFRAPEFAPERSKIIFYKDDLPYFADVGRARELAEQKKAAEIQPKLRGHDIDLPVPVGEFKDLGTYYPIQNELPATYRVGTYRVAKLAPALRKAQSRQLKAYLMFFEQLLANYLAQLAHVAELFSWKTRSGPTYFTQPVSGIADIEDLFTQRYLQDEYGALLDIVEDAQAAQKRKAKFLEHLIARFCESFADYSVLMYGMFKDNVHARLIEDKRLFLEDYPRLSGHRGRAFDYRYPGDEANLSGFQRRVYRLLGFRDLRRRNLAGHRLVVERIEQTEESDWRFVLKDENGGLLFESVPCNSENAAEVLLDFALGIGGLRRNYTRSADDGKWELRRRGGALGGSLIGRTFGDGEEDLAKVLEYFATYGDSEGFHLVENILLRTRTEDDPYLSVQLTGRDSSGQLTDPLRCDCVTVTDPYSFRVTIVLPAWPLRFRDMSFRRFVEETLRVEAPAHIHARICWISHTQMKAFECDYGDWSQGLAALEDVRRLGDEDVWTGDSRVPRMSPPPPYAEFLQRLKAQLDSLVTVYPLARLHDCQAPAGDTPPVTLNNTSLGTF